MKIRNKITLLFTLLVTSILLVLNLSVYYLTSADRKEIFRTRIKGRANNNAQVFDYFGDSSIYMLRKLDTASLVIMPQKTVVIYDTTGTPLYQYHAPNADTFTMDKERLKDVIQSGEKFFTLGSRDGVMIRYTNAEKVFVIVVAAYDEDGWLRLSKLKKVLTLSLLIGMLVTLITGYVFSSQLVKPIKGIIHEVNDISSHNLSKRLPTGISQDELNDLAMTFNDLLNRLQESFATQRRFISNASHELSTPLTSISSQLQVTLQKERTAKEYQEVMQSIQEDVEQMRQLTKSLLEIAKTGSRGAIELNDLRVDELLLKVISDMKRINHEYDVKMDFFDLPDEEKQCMVFGNFDLLYSAFKNIIENGCKYSPDKTSVVNVSFTEKNILIKVINNGDIIAQQELDQIFQPFFRGANVADDKGFGLGLPLAKRIIALHKGEISVTSGDEGTCFTIILPNELQL